MYTKNNNIDFKEAEIIDLRELFSKWLHHWHWFLICILIIGGITAYYLRKTIPEYSVSATILIKDAKKGVGDAMSEIAAFQDLSMFSNSLNSLDNEIEILKSRSLLAKVIRELNLNVQYKFEGRIRTVEYYNDAPVELKFVDGDSIKNRTNCDLKLTIISDKQYSLEDEKNGHIGLFYFNKKASTPYGNLIFASNFIEIPNNTEIFISVTPLAKMADEYSQKINVSPLSKQATIITVSLEDAVKFRARDFVNTLIKLYNTDGINEKNQVSKNTADFIANRLELIREELNQVEDKVALYKQAFELTDINTEASLFLENSVNTKKELIRLSTELSVIEFMIDYLQENKNSIKLLPTNIGLTDLSIANSVANFNKLVMDRNRLLNNSSLKNPIIQNFDTQLIELQQVLTSSLVNLKQSVSIQISGLNEEIKQNTSRITDVPKQEKEFRAIKRQQEIKEALYLYLLQKREETDISLAVTVANAKLVDPAFINHIPVRPKKELIYLEL